MRAIVFLIFLVGCGGVAWNTTVADHPDVRAAMLASIEPGLTTETRFRTQWGAPTQKVREGAQVAYVYRNMSNPPGYPFPQFGNSGAYVVVVFQYGVAVAGYSSDTEGCRATFAPRPPGVAYANPSTVMPVNCGQPRTTFTGSTAASGDPRGPSGTQREYPGVPPDTYPGEKPGKFR